MSDIDALIRQINALEQRLDELVLPEVGRWIDWTPTVTQGVAVTRTISYARYIVMSDAVHMVVRLAITSAGTAANAIVIAGIPTTIAPANIAGLGTIGSFIMLDSGVARYVGIVLPVGANDFRFWTDPNVNYVGITPGITLASGDDISFQATFER